jgi:ribonuclease J
MSIDIIDLHTSGHADINTIKEVADYLNPNIIIPIHTTDKFKVKELLKNSVVLEDQEEMEI